MKRYAGGTIDPALGAQFESAIGQRGAYVTQIKNPKRQFEESAFQIAATPQTNQLNAILQGTPMSSFYPFAGGNVLDSFRTQNASAFDPPSMQLTEPETNVTQPVTRYVKPHTDTLDGCALHELVFAYKEDPHQTMQTMRSGAGYISQDPMNIINPATLNHTLCAQQIWDAKRDYDDYKLKTPWDYWAPWTVDGIVEFEQMLDGSESVTTSGFSGRYNSQAGNGYKVVTLSSKGPQYVYNYFGSNIKAGGTCYMIIKKHSMPDSFVLDNKLNEGSLAGNHRVHDPMPYSNGVHVLVRPYQVSFLCLPNGGPLPPEATTYFDEDGMLKRDGLAIYLGKIWSTPIDHQFRNISNFFNVDPLTRRVPEYKEYGAHNNANQGVDRSGTMYMKLILDCDDGIAP